MAERGGRSRCLAGAGSEVELVSHDLRVMGSNPVLAWSLLSKRKRKEREHSVRFEVSELFSGRKVAI